ncbi:MAG: hypothetical protein CFE21_13925 [Bacteroidetes bacterium B1(2017)]|nr:MAG: hypothetical protein CFE21_13925 [Bacteroidetes bacterium B1(2017)]
MKQRLLFFIFLLPLLVQGQNCKIITATNKVCLGNTLLFNVTFDAGLTASSYSWNFGNAATSSQPGPVYQYPARGKFVPRVTINFTNTTSCTVFGDTIQVVDNPKANFNVTTALTQCFKNNLTCMDDISTVGLDNAPITSRTFLYGDGGFSNQAPGTGNTICHNYSNPLGGVYTLVLEVTDANMCMSRKERIDYVTVYSKMQDISFRTNYVTQCNKTPVLFTNTSKMLPANVASYEWDFGDGTKQTSPWSSFTHTYTANGVFDARLSIIDKNGCRDTFYLNRAGENYAIDSTIYLSSNAMCFYHNGVRVRSNNFYPGASQVFWAYYKVGNPNRIDTVLGNLYTDTFNFPDCGVYQIRMYVKLGNCFVRADTTVKIFGPHAVMDIYEDAIVNSIQCEVHDTVLFRTPVGDHSCYYNNGAIDRIWDFGDPFAPQCTTDTKANQNVGLNCNYSRDSSNVRHAYKPGEDRCYYPRLILTDPISGCTDTSSSPMKLTQPDAGWDSTSTPIRRGLYYNPKKPCLNSPVTFYLDETLPKCGREKVWFMADSACTIKYWEPIDSSLNFFSHTYTSTCDPSGYVTVGLIIKNGKDKNGKDCYDTAWYHHYFRFFLINPIFTVVRTNTGCGPWAVKLTLLDSIQDSIAKVVFDFRNGPSSVKTIIMGPTDSIIPSQYYTYLTPGIKQNIGISITNTRGCVQTYFQTIYFGFQRSFKPDKQVLCLSDTLTLIDDISYYNTLYQYWRDSTRAKAGKEQVYWDFGDGRGFVQSGGLPKWKYSKVGNYRLRMVAIDSLGCKDTFTYVPNIKVVDLEAAIKPMQARYLCAPQILNFNDKSLYFDSSALYGQTPYDSIINYLWSFGDNKLSSLLKDPVHDYTANGNYTVKLVIRSYAGCVDSTTIPIWIDGPRPQFTILSDTVGCAPFKLILKNTTGYPLVNWIWYFRDQNNATASTQLDTNVSHIYTKGGIYKIYLVGEDTIFNPLSGQYKTCLAAYPDSMNINSPKRTIRVIDAIHAGLEAPDTVCIGEPFDLYAHPEGLVPGFAWMYGDNTPTKQTLYPDTVETHTFFQFGSYQVKMYPLKAGNLCTDTAVKTITVANVQADFDLDDSKMPTVTFTNKSKDAVRYAWDFGNPKSGSKNSSTLENPTHYYTGDSGSFVVCLIAYNNQDCWDSICKRTIPAEMHLIIPNVFTPNEDGKNDSYDIDILGYQVYNLNIYNRWGNRVYESTIDGIGHDDINWNGTNFNNGFECPEGVYYFVFKYQMNNQKSLQEVHGTITLLRDE